MSFFGVLSVRGGPVSLPLWLMALSAFSSSVEKLVLSTAWSASVPVYPQAWPSPCLSLVGAILFGASLSGLVTDCVASLLMRGGSMRSDAHVLLVSVFVPVAPGCVKEVQIFRHMWRSRLLMPNRSHVGPWLQGFILFDFGWKRRFVDLMSPFVCSHPVQMKHHTPRTTV